MKKILIILGHPDTESFCGALADAYESGAREAGHEVRRINLGDLSFDPILHHGYKQLQELEPDLLTAQTDMSWAQHWVIVYPVWWGTHPALLKGFFDRLILPGFAFKFHPDKLLPDKLLSGHSARLLVTMDAPYLYHWLVMGNAGIRSVRDLVLGFCGVSPKRTKVFSSLKTSSVMTREKYLNDAKRLGTGGV